MDHWWLPVALAPFVGSFLGVLVRRMPAGRPVLLDRSRCEGCGHTLSPVELVPVASYVLQRGRCRACGARIAPMHLAIELAAMAIAGSAAAVDDGPALWAGCGLGWTLLALAWIDAEAFWLPDALTLPLIVAGLLATWWLTPWAVTDHALAAVIGYAAFRGLSLAYARLRGRDGLGEGGAKLLAASGAWLGLGLLPAVILIGATAGLALALAWKVGGREVGRMTTIPFGPPLAIATWLCWIAGGSPW